MLEALKKEACENRIALLNREIPAIVYEVMNIGGMIIWVRTVI